MLQKPIALMDRRAKEAKSNKRIEAQITKLKAVLGNYRAR